ncbi:MAG: hypothetical protein RIC55_36495 [Pirellulaceae bacterium]
MWAAPLVALGATTPSVNLTPSAGEDTRQVAVNLEVKGELLIQPPDKAVQRLALLAKGEISYHERLTPKVALRYYREARADIAIAGGSAAPRLDPRRRLVAVDLLGSRPTLYSPAGPLTRELLELLDVQGSSAIVDRLLPGKTVKVGDTWPDDAETLAQLLGLDVVHQSGVQSNLVKIEDKLAVVEFGGQVSGAVNGVPSEIGLNGTYTFDIERRHIESLALAIGEKRPIGPAEPGFEVSARIEVRIDPLGAAEELGDEVLAALPPSAQGEPSLLALDTEGAAFRLLHGRQWRVVGEDRQSAVLRLVDHGDVVAQCNVHRLTDLEQDKRQPTLEQFHADVKKSLDKNYGQIVDSKQLTTPEGLRLLHVAIESEVSEVPVRWNYYHLGDGQGRQATCVFTLKRGNLERLGGDDMQIASSLALRGTIAKPAATSKPVAGPEPTPAQTSRRTNGAQSK